MCQNCSRKISKFFLVLINLIFFLAGMLMLAFGIAIVAAPDKVVSIFGNVNVDIRIIPSNVLTASGIFMIILGGLVGIIGMFGFFGACCDNMCMLITYIVIMIIILLAEVALIVFAAVFPDQLKSDVQKGMNKTLITNFATQDIQISANGTISLPNDANAAAWATTQFEVGCCGAYGRADYANLTQKSVTYSFTSPALIVDRTFPISCCALNHTGIPKLQSDFVDFTGCLSSTNTTSVNEKNCYSAVDQLLNSYSKIAIGIAAGIAGLQVILIIMGIILVCHIRKYGKSATV